MDNVKILNDRDIIKTDKYIKISKPRTLNMKKNDEAFFEKAYQALDEAVKKLENDTKQNNINSMFEEDNSLEKEQGMHR